MTEKKTILAVDDDLSICESIRLLGEKSGFTVNTALSAKTFNKMYAVEQPDIVVLDLNLGEQSDGIELLRELAKLGSPSKIIIMSGYDEKILNSALLLGKTMQLNIIGTLHKPIDIERFQALLESTSYKKMSIDNIRLISALENNEFVLFYQPKIEIKTGKLTGFEALIRWQVQDSNIIQPDSFISIAEKGKLINQISSWVNQEAIKQCQYLVKEGWDICMSINISSLLLTNLMLPDQINELAKLHGLDTRHICIEITESAAMSDPSNALDILTRFRIKGFSLSIDDFGTGYSSLVELQKMPCSELKIDKSFVINLVKDSPEHIICRSIINLGHDFGMKVVAEGVESYSSLQILNELGCDIAQGYFIAKPMPINELLIWLNINLDSSKIFKLWRAEHERAEQR